MLQNFHVIIVSVVSNSGSDPLVQCFACKTIWICIDAKKTDDDIIEIIRDAFLSGEDDKAFSILSQMPDIQDLEECFIKYFKSLSREDQISILKEMKENINDK